MYIYIYIYHGSRPKAEGFRWRECCERSEKRGAGLAAPGDPFSHQARIFRFFGMQVARREVAQFCFTAARPESCHNGSRAHPWRPQVAFRTILHRFRKLKCSKKA